MKKGNVVIGQSGGPTSVINASLAGAFKTAEVLGANKVYGMLNGIKGLLERRFVDMSEQVATELDLELLKRTPSSFLGSCRFKLPKAEEKPEVYTKIFEILHEMDIKHFFYIGGNDSMDTIQKLSAYARDKKIAINFMGVPKTIDNDLNMTDHSPGFGSAAKYVATAIKELALDSGVYGSEMITIVEIMGRNAGWLTASAVLARTEDCAGADLIYLPETVFDMDKFLAKIEELRKQKNSILVAISEGVKTADGKFVCEMTQATKTTDAFGHKQMGGTAHFLADYITSKFGCKTRPIELSSLQRCGAHIASLTDINEAFLAGAESVKASFNGETGKVAIFTRLSTNPYTMKTEIVEVEKVANIEKKVPKEWIINDGTYVSNEAVEYMRPLIAGELLPIMVEGLPRHLVLKSKK